MKIQVICVGKTDQQEIKNWIFKYIKRVSYYALIEWIEIPILKKNKKLRDDDQKVVEGKQILKKLGPTDYLILFDESGKEFSSNDFSFYLQKKMNSGIKKIVFVVGGSYGFSEELYQRSQEKFALSKMTFSHQMVRIFIIEQFYRAYSILNKQPYHH